jgi:hypothetical protein
MRDLRQAVWFGVAVIAACKSSGGPGADGGVDASAADAGGDVVAETGTAAAPWSWGDGTATENVSVAFMGYDQGCTQFGGLRETAAGVSFDVGYGLSKPPADRLKHFAGDQTAPAVDDGSLVDYAVAGTVLLLQVRKVQFDQQGDSASTAIGDLLRVAGQGAASATMASFSASIAVPGGNPCASAPARCRAEVQPTFVIVWQQAGTKQRAYQFLRPYLIAPHLFDAARNADCPTAPAGSAVTAGFRQGLGVSWPLREDLSRRLDGAPDPTRWSTWIDEVLPR